MGLTSKRVYFDSCVAIYLVEEHPIFSPTIEALLANYASVDDLIIQVSELTEMECLVMPLRKVNQALLDKYTEWFESVEVLPISREAFRRAAKLRADFSGLKTPDAIHLATALHHNCDEFWTNDNRLNNTAPGFARDILIP